MSSIQKREIHIDTLNGEIIHDKTNVIDFTSVPNEPDYIKLYIGDLGKLCCLSDGQKAILLYIAACVGYDGLVLLPVGQKARIAKSAKCSISAVNNAVNFFCKKQILIKEGGGLYELNPDYFARGKWREIRERRKSFYTKITYTPDGQKTVETNVID
jgi:hypothetical protein